MGGGMVEGRWADALGRTQTLADHATETPARALAAFLDRADLAGLWEGDALPGLWIWLYFLPLAPSAEIGEDGHPRRGGFLPAVDLPRRMWAGSRCTFHAPLRLGERLERTSTITAVAEKAGKAGPMVFVTAHHAVSTPAGLAYEEEQDIVYLNVPDRFAPPPPTPLPECAWSEAAAVDPVRLFRFSALTFNAHRIHYDRAYAMEAERYPGLVVHGPLQAMLLFDAATRRAPGRAPATFEFRGLRPLFDSDAVTLNGRPRDHGAWDLFTAQGEGAVGMQAKLTWRAD